MREQIALGSGPKHEPLAEFHTAGYGTRARMECRAYIAEIKAVLGDPPENAEFALKATPVPGGQIWGVVVLYDPLDQLAREYAFGCQSAVRADRFLNWTTVGMAVIHGDDESNQLLSKIVEGGHELMEREPSSITAIIEPQ